MLPDSDREDSAAEAKAGGLVVAPKQMSSALGSLMSNYGSMTDSDEEPEGTEDMNLISYVQYVHDPPRSRVSATPIQRAKDLVQENQALLNALPPSNQERGSSTGPESAPKGSEAPRVHTPSNRRRRRGRGGRGRHDTPQSRRATLLEMVRRRQTE